MAAAVHEGDVLVGPQGTNWTVRRANKWPGYDYTLDDPAQSGGRTGASPGGIQVTLKRKSDGQVFKPGSLPKKLG